MNRGHEPSPGWAEPLLAPPHGSFGLVTACPKRPPRSLAVRRGGCCSPDATCTERCTQREEREEPLPPGGAGGALRPRGDARGDVRPLWETAGWGDHWALVVRPAGRRGQAVGTSAARMAPRTPLT